MKTKINQPQNWSKDNRVEDGYARWVENGVWYQAPVVDPQKYGGHDYDNGGFDRGIRDCACGCRMDLSSSGGPVDPFGACPMNPKDDSCL